MDTHVTAAKIIEAAARVYKEIGPGSVESVYLASLLIELKRMGVFSSPNVSCRLDIKDMEKKLMDRSG